MWRKCKLVQKWTEKRNIHLYKVLEANHYDALGLTPAATQAQIKSAYYELSKLYHPDTNEGKEDALARFRAITEAYEILGTVRSRKLYDRGMVLRDSGAVLRDDDPDDGGPTVDPTFARSRHKANLDRFKGRTTVYDFDAWAKAHYSQTRERKQEDIEKYRRVVSQQQLVDDGKEKQFVVFSVAAFLIGYFLVSFIDVGHEDNVRLRRRNSRSNTVVDPTYVNNVDIKK